MTPGPFTAHMLAHMTLVVAVAPLVAAALVRTRVNRLRCSPITASLIEFVVVWAWHTPALHLSARHHIGMFLAEQVSFLAAATLLWLAILGGDREARALRAGTGIIALVLTFAHMTMLGAIMALSPRALYAHGSADLGDQQLGGAVMIAVSTIAYLGAALWLSRSLLQMQPKGARS